MANVPLRTLLNRVNRTGTVKSAGEVVPADATGKITVMSDVAPADLADPTKWLRIALDVFDFPAGSGQWYYDQPGPDGRPRVFAGVTFQLGPAVIDKNGTVDPNGANRGFAFNAPEVAGKTVRGIIVVKAGDPDATPEPADATIRVGLTYQVSG